LIFAFIACTKITNSNIGSGLIPPVDGVLTRDTILDIVTKNQAFDTVAVGFSDDHVLGYTADPVFGATTAAINFQVSLPNTNFSFGVDKNTLVFDSVILSLSYKGVWGDSIQPLALHVYEMDPENKFSVDSAYNNTISFEKGIELTQNNTAAMVSPYTLNDPDTLKQSNENATNQLRIHLSEAFGNRLLHDYDSLHQYRNDSTFHNAVRGFIVEAEQQGSALLRVNLSDTSTRLSLYYHYTNSAGDTDTVVRRFATNALTCASSNTITRNYQNTDIQKYFPANPNAQDSLLYIQTSPGTYARLSIPGLKGLQNMVVHRAEILMSQVPDGAFSQFTVPNLFLAAYSQDSARRFAVPNDLIFSGGTIANLTAFGVLPVKKANSLSTYNFDISRYTQGIVTRHDSAYDLILWAPYNYYIEQFLQYPYAYPISIPALNPVAIGRVILGGGNNTNYKMRLHIVYSPVQ
jgi:hypothetical protein